MSWRLVLSGDELVFLHLKNVAYFNVQKYVCLNQPLIWSFIGSIDKLSFDVISYRSHQTEEVGTNIVEITVRYNTIG